MKKQLITFLLLGFLSNTVFAHPNDNAPLTQIDEGSTLTILRDLNIPSNGTLSFQTIGMTQGNFVNYSSNRAYCYIRAYDSHQVRFDKDVVLRTGLVLTLVEIGTDYLKATTSSGNYLFVYCGGIRVASTGWVRNDPRIADIRSVFKNYIELNLADPVEFN